VNVPRSAIFRLVAVLIGIAIPVALVLVVELALRAAGFGHPAAFYLEDRQAGTVRPSPDFTATSFPRRLVRRPSPFVLPATKPAEGYRIFVLGASAAQGDPGPALSVARVLEVMLERSFPEVRFEVVNAALTATNSHVPVSIADDCAELDPDLFVSHAVGLEPGNAEFREALESAGGAS
jgi:hypothetical protein